MVYLIKYKSLAKNGMLTDRQIEKVGGKMIWTAATFYYIVEG